MSQKVNIGVPKNINTATTTLVKTGNGVLYAIVVNTAAAGTTSIYDGLTAGGTLIGVQKASIAEGHYIFNCGFKTGLCIVTGHNDQDITVIYE